MSRFFRFALMAAGPALVLSACGDGADAPGADGGDPAVAGALGDELMIDPDLAGENGANSAVSAGRRDGTLPSQQRSPQAIAKARAEALNLLGGPGNIKKAPAAVQVTGTLPQGAALSAAARAAAAPGGNVNCADKAEYTMAWAAKLPNTFPVYPQGSVQEAAGTDDGNCALRVVNFITALPTAEVVDFYYTRAADAGYSAQRVVEGGDDVLGGVKGAASYVIYVRKLASGVTEVDLVTSGG